MSKLINGRTTEEIITGLKCEVPCHKCAYRDHNFMKDDSCSYYVEQDIIALIEYLEAQQPKWISVKEQEPVFPCLYWDGVNTPAVAKSLVAITLKDGKEVFVADALLEVFPEALQGLLEDCTHILYWMPLPEPPKEENV